MNDYTQEIGFWKRLHSFVKDVQTGCIMGEEEKDMLLIMAERKIKELDKLHEPKE